MNQLPSCYVSSKLIGQEIPGKGGHGLFADTSLAAGERLVVFGGRVIDTQELAALDASLRRLALQVDEEVYLLSVIEGPGDWVNHSCSPNAGMFGQLVLVAMRDIEPGEEICYDYAMTDGSPYDEFPCSCGSEQCRGRVTSRDWQRPELRTRYHGYFSPYLERRIDALQRRHPARPTRALL